MRIPLEYGRDICKDRHRYTEIVTIAIALYGRFFFGYFLRLL